MFKKLTNKALTMSMIDQCQKIENGTLEVQTPSRETLTFGIGEPHAAIKLKSWDVVRQVFTRGDVGFGEAYVDNLWESPDISKMVELALKNEHIFNNCIHGGFMSRLKLAFFNRLLKANTRKGSRRNITFHYDIGNEFYKLWLDPSMMYSSALFQDGASDLESGQLAKNRRLVELTKNGNDGTLLEIGCGWGGFAEQAAEAGRDVTAITISKAQFDFASARLRNKVKLLLQDYRDTKGKFSSIVSIEMVEALGEKYWQKYFSIIKDRLLEGGKAGIQAITIDNGVFETYRRSSDFIREHVFPGGMLMTKEILEKLAVQSGLRFESTLSFGLDYSKTLDIWLGNFDKATKKIKELGLSEEFIRCWRFYLSYCSGAFRTGRTDVVQVVLANG